MTSCSTRRLPAGGPASHDLIRRSPIHTSSSRRASSMAFSTTVPPFSSAAARRARPSTSPSTAAGSPASAAWCRATRRPARTCHDDVRVHAVLPVHRPPERCQRGLARSRPGPRGRARTIVRHARRSRRPVGLQLPGRTTGGNAVPGSRPKSLGYRTDTHITGSFDTYIAGTSDTHAPVAIIEGWSSDFPYPSNFFDPLLTCASPGPEPATTFCDPKLDRLVRSAKEAQGTAAVTLWQAADRDAVDQAAWAPLTNELGVDVIGAGVGNYQHNPRDRNSARPALGALRRGPCSLLARGRVGRLRRDPTNPERS